MSNLSSEARRVIALARRADDPNAADQRRVGLGLAKRLSAGATGIAISIGTAKATASAAAVTILGKSVIFIAIGTAVALSLGQPSSRADNTVSNAARVTHKSVHPTSAANPSAPVTNIEGPVSSSIAQEAKPLTVTTVQDSRKVSSPSASQVPQLAAAKEAMAVNGVRELPSNSVGRRAATAKFEPLPEPAAAAPDSIVDPLQAETAALREAQRALRAGDPASAITLTKVQDATYQAGALGQERAAVRIFALCAIGNAAQARSEADDFI